jgi:uncharacterized protein
MQNNTAIQRPDIFHRQKCAHAPSSLSSRTRYFTAMPIKVNLRHLEDKSVQLEGELPIKELDLMLTDDMVQPAGPLHYDIEVTRQNQNLLIQGNVGLTLDCKCVRCLRPLKQELEIDPYDAFIPLEGEDRAPIENDLVDLTPYVREDILLAIPTHPVCAEGCARLPQFSQKEQAAMQDSRRKEAWNKLDKLKLK